MRQLKGDNRGLSLIEVLVAVVVLAIVVTPFLRSFITTANTNNKAKAMHKATVVAQSVMEGCKSETLEDVASQFNDPAQGFRIVDGSRIRVEDGRSLSDYVYELRDREADGIYCFALENVKEDASVYDVLVTLNANRYREDAPDGSGERVDINHRYNDTDMAKLPIMNEEKDAICVQKQKYTENAVEQFLAACSTSTEEEIRSKMTRTITIDVDRALIGTTEYRTRVTVTYHYYCKPLNYDMQEYIKTLTCFDSTETEEDLRSVYLYYYPLYASSEIASRDTIIFNNKECLPVNFYLMKQAQTGATPTSDNDYRMNLAIYEDGADAESANTKLFTNLGLNVNVDPVQQVNNPNAVANITFNYSSVSLSEVNTSTLDFETMDRVFDVEVSVYTAGAADAGFPDDKCIATISGSRIN